MEFYKLVLMVGNGFTHTRAHTHTRTYNNNNNNNNNNSNIGSLTVNDKYQAF